MNSILFHTFLSKKKRNGITEVKEMWCREKQNRKEILAQNTGYAPVSFFRQNFCQLLIVLVSQNPTCFLRGIQVC